MKAVFLSLMLLLQVRAAARADEFPRLEVSAAPSRVRMAAGEDWSRTRYTFRNLSPHEFRVVERSAFFHAFDTTWQSGIIGPIPTPLKVKALAETTWDDDIWIAPEIVTAAREAGALPNQELLFVQSFTLLGPGDERTHVSATVVFRIPEAARVTRVLKGRRSEATYPAEWEEDVTKMKQLTRFLEFADACYDKLAEVLGFDPRPGGTIALRIIYEGGTPYFQEAEGGYINLPTSVVLNQDSSDWIWVVYPHELTHFFLLTAFPNPPRWFVEGPASFFGNKVSAALNFQATTDADRQKILGWAKASEERGDAYLFETNWPDDGYAFGLGRGYKICAQLEGLCGPNFFIETFRSMHQNQFSFPLTASEKQRNELLFSAMQVHTSEDIWAFFTRAGFQR